MKISYKLFFESLPLLRNLNLKIKLLRKTIYVYLIRKSWDFQILISPHGVFQGQVWDRTVPQVFVPRDNYDGTVLQNSVPVPRDTKSVGTAQDSCPPGESRGFSTVPWLSVPRQPPIPGVFLGWRMSNFGFLVQTTRISSKIPKVPKRFTVLWSSTRE